VKIDLANGQRKAEEEKQKEIVAAMMQPGFYPKPPAKVTHKETHISHLFFAGELVYKIKKAVRYSFLDYSTLDNRRHFINEELRLNRRLATSVYLAVVPITKAGLTWQLAGEGEPIEYALVMRRLPENRMFPFLLETHQVTREMMEGLADVLARFHRQAERIMPAAPSEYPDQVSKQWNDNLADLESFPGAVIDAEMVTVLKEFDRRFIGEHSDLLIQRAQEGWIRDVHGDLHCENICFAPEGIQIFDCIEFSSEFRRCDLASEVAFLLMDLEVRGGGALIDPFLTRYCALMEDPELPKLLPLYKSYRALVRAKVQALRGAYDAAASYFRFATRFTWEPLKPFLVMVCGLTGSGKSTLARELGERLGMPVINSDAVRKSLAKKSGRQTVAFNTGIYNPAMTEKTYAEMAREAEKEILNGMGAILDATFRHKTQREKIIRIAQKHQVPLFLIHCFAAEETTKRRLTERAVEGKDVSDGRWEIYREQVATEEPIDELPSAARLELNTDAPTDELVRASEQFLRARLNRL
jgi:uncharacterized protein